MANPALSISALNTLRKCPQQWVYRHLRNLRRAAEVPAIPLEFGTWWHALRAADSYRRGTDLGSLRAPLRSIQLHDDLPKLTLKGIDPADLRGMILEQAEQWFSNLDGETRDLWLTELRQPLVERLEHADALWTKRWERETAHEAPLAVEWRFRTRIKGTVVPGVIDEIVQDEARGLVVVRDHKTGRDIHSASAADDMMEPQLHIYTYAAMQQVEDWGLRLNAISYDRTRSTGPQVPKLTAQGNLAKVPSDYDLDTYRGWAAGPLGEGVGWGEPDSYYASGAKKGQPKFGLYLPEDKIIEQLSTPAAIAKWNDRTLVPLNPNLIRAHLRSFVGSARMAASYREEFDNVGEVHRSLGRGCQWCDFRDLCRAEMIGGPGGDYPLDQFNLTQR